MSSSLLKSLNFEFETFKDTRGDLTVIEKIIPFPIKRIYFIYNTNNESRGFHYHKLTTQLAICIQGNCTFNIELDNKTHSVKLNKPTNGLLIPTMCYHWMSHFSKDCILMVFASREYDASDYFIK